MGGFKMKTSAKSKAKHDLQYALQLWIAVVTSFSFFLSVHLYSYKYCQYQRGLTGLKALTLIYA